MINEELDDIIFNAAFEVFYSNSNWIEYGDLLYQAGEKIKEIVPQITVDIVENWIKGCIENEYISVARSNQGEITADDYCRGEWLGLDKE